MRRSIAILVALLSLTACPPRGNATHGQRIATLTGCVSCHGKKLDGHLFEENPQFALAWSSNLSRILPRWSDAEIAAALRRGRRPDGSALWFMPTFVHAHLSDADMRDLIAWLRTVPPSGTLHPPIKRGPQFAVAMQHGFEDSASQAKRLATRLPVDVGAKTARGRYLASIACAECHGPDLTGPRDPRPGDPPDIGAGAAYTDAAFARLLHDGIRQDGEPAGLMAQEAPKRLRALTAEDVRAIKAYVNARASR